MRDNKREDRWRGSFSGGFLLSASRKPKVTEEEYKAILKKNGIDTII